MILAALLITTATIMQPSMPAGLHRLDVPVDHKRTPTEDEVIRRFIKGVGGKAAPHINVMVTSTSTNTSGSISHLPSSSVSK